jgi:hypothetical protein
MLKLLVILGILLAGVLVCAQKPLPMQGSHQQEQTHVDKVQPDTPPPCATEVCKENADNAERYAYYEAHPKEYLKAAIAPANLSNWILAGLGLIGGVLALCTIRKLERQTKATEDSVKVSRGASKAWIVGKVFEVKPKSAWPGVNEASQFFWEIENQGQTPAFITSVAVDRFMLDSIDAKPPKPLVDNKVYAFLGAGRQERHTVEFTPATIQKARKQGRVLKVYAAIKYRDIFEESWETGFSFRYHFNTGPNDPIEERFFQESDISYNYNRKQAAQNPN